MTAIASPIEIQPAAASVTAPGLSITGVTKRFGSLLALDNVSMKVRPGTMHALLGGNGAGKSTLVKCIMGYYLPDEGQIALGGVPVTIRNPREALRLGIGMVYQHFTLVGNMTVAENLVLSRGKVPAIIDWKKEYADLRGFMRTTPFFIPIGEKVSSLAAGQKQKLEICKQLYLKNKVLFLDEPTSVLTPAEADELLSMLKQRTQSGELTVLMITHKFREVMKFADEVTVLRTGRLAGTGLVKDLTPADMSAMMIGSETTRTAARGDKPRGQPLLHIDGIHALDDIGLKALDDLNLQVHAGEIVGIAGVSGNGQSKLVEVLAGQRPATAGQVRIHGEPYFASRAEIRKHRVNCLPEEPLKNTCIGSMSVAQNMALRNFDQHPHSVLGFFLNKGSIRRAAQDLIHRYQVKTPGPETPIRDLSGGNVQRAVLARELSEKVEVLIAANPCFGLDFAAAAEIRAQIIEARNRGAAVLLVSEDLDEIFELSDRIVVMFHGKFVYETTAAEAEIGIIGPTYGRTRMNIEAQARRIPMRTDGGLLSPFILSDLFSERVLASRTWEPFRAGIEIHWIYGSPNAASAALLRYAPGAALERHFHAGFEHILVLRGSQTDDNGNHGRGTLLIHAPGTSHAVHSPEGCIVLAIWERSVYACPANPIRPVSKGAP